MSKALIAMNAMWEFGSTMVEKHGGHGDETMTDPEHEAWQEAAGLCHDALQEEKALKAVNASVAGAPNENVTLPAWVVNELVGMAKPAFQSIADEMGKAGQSASEQMQNERGAIQMAEASLTKAVINPPKIEF